MKEIFVFGSNREGRHGKGAALVAYRKYGAIYGQATGRQGNSYAIITKELRVDQPPVTLSEIEQGVKKFLKYAETHQRLKFIVTPLGCGLAGFKYNQIAPMFCNCSSNIDLPEEFKSDK